WSRRNLSETFTEDALPSKTDLVVKCVERTRCEESIILGCVRTIGPRGFREQENSLSDRISVKFHFQLGRCWQRQSLGADVENQAFEDDCGFKRRFPTIRFLVNIPHIDFERMLVAAEEAGCKVDYLRIDLVGGRKRSVEDCIYRRG